MTLDEARQFLHEWVAGASLRGHMEAVSACMEAYAGGLAPAEAERWAVAGLLHDVDYEKHPSAESGHPFVAVRALEVMGVDAEIREAILGHADYSGVPRTTPMAMTLYAVDELAGFIVACAKVRPAGIGDLEASSVRKKLKDKAFAAAVSREDIARGLQELSGIVPGLEASAHIATCIGAIRASRERVGV